VKSKLLMLVLGGTLSLPAAAQNLTRPLVTEPVDDSNRVLLHGNVHPLAQTKYDQGAVSDTFRAERVLLLLNRPPEQQTALEKFLNDVHRRGSASFHQWLTPEEFGNRFGPADSDIQAVAGWLESHGFRIARVTKSKQFLEFSGTAGQLRDAFRTQIHQYSVQGEMHYANATEISIPQALAGIVGGLAPLNNFRAESYLRREGTAHYSPATKKAVPYWTIPNPFGTPNPEAFLVAPEDLATQYDITPLYQAGINGTGVTIGIINESNIDISLVEAYQQLFNIPVNPPQVVIDGDDPGVLDFVASEAYLDVEVSGAIAPKSTVNLYISNGSDLADPLALAAIRAVEDNQAEILSVSFGNCEATLGDAGNLFWSSLWAEATAQGQTVFVASGDSGPYCNIFFPNAVSGIASTPWNVAVGGTDFFYADYATGGASATTFWNAANDSSLGSLIAPLTEQAWNDGFGLDVISDGLARGEIGAGGGGPSNCTTISSTTNQCVGGYTKPSWQSGPGVTNDGSRDMPDVALYASNGANLSAYPICDFEGACTPGTATTVNVDFVGGTSASSPLMAGILALVVAKYGRQGQADFTLYPLAQQKPTAFHDITLGNNTVLCDQGTTNCAQNANGIFETTVYSAGPGYDMATGLGSVDANVLVNNWNSISFKPTTTALQLSASHITHGTPITVTTTVASSSAGAETPTGNVAILTNSPLPSSQSQTFVPLSGGTGSSTVNFFPGGSYDVTANYQGDGIFGDSSSAPVLLDVNPEDSTIAISIENNFATVASSTQVLYGTPLALSIQPTGIHAPKGKSDGNATGTATFTVDSTSTTVALNSVGVASLSPPALSIGTHTASATYFGDASFNSSSASPVMFTVTKGVPFIRDSIQGNFSSTAPQVNVNTGGTLVITVVVVPFNTISGTAPPTGTLTACLGFEEVCVNPSYTQTATLSSVVGENAQSSVATLTFTNLAAGQYFPTYSYSGDANWQQTSLLDLVNIVVGPQPALTASTTALSITPSTISGLQLAQITTTVTGSGNSGIAPSGLVLYYDNGVLLTLDVLTPAKSGATSSAMFSFNSSAFFNNGPNQVTAIYQGDNNYQPSTSNAASITVTQLVGDFLLAPQLPQVSVAIGNSVNVGIGLTSVNNFNGIVNLSCSTSGAVTCGVNPPSAMLNGSTTATLMITPMPTPATRPARTSFVILWPGAGGGVALGVVLLMGLTIRKRRFVMAAGVSLVAVLLFIASCGGNGTSSSTPPPPPPNANVYSVVVTGTANGYIHNAKVSVVVP